MKMPSDEIKIGDQIWMIENLNVDTFANGDRIIQITNFEDWENFDNNSEPAWCYYNFDPMLGTKYGKLYNWHAVSDERNLSPKGWRIPSLTDWMILIGNAIKHQKEFENDLIDLSNDENNLTQGLEELDSIFGFKVNDSATSLKSLNDWISEEYPLYTNNPFGTNISGFNALPAGFLEYFKFTKLYHSACFWTTTESDDSDSAWAIDLKSCQHYDDGGSREDSNGIIPLWQTKDISCGLSIRCIKV